MSRRGAVAGVDRIAHRDALFDLLAATPEGLTIDQMAAAMGCTRHPVREAIHDLRLFLGDDDSVNVPCTNDVPGQQWVYRLVGTLGDVREWIANRITDAETRMETMQAIMASVVAATTTANVDPIDERAAALIERGIRHLLEDLRALRHAS